MTAAPEVEVIEPKAAHKVYSFGPQKEITLVQKPLSFFGKMEFFALLGTAIEKALSSSTTVGQMLEGVPQRGETLTPEDLRDADEFVKLLASLVQYAPDLLADLYVIILGVPKGQRDYVKHVMSQHEDDGGLSDEQGTEILETFFDQNWDVMVDFFKSRVMPLVEKVSKKVSGTQSAS